jgi:hypothetical protein
MDDDATCGPSDLALGAIDHEALDDPVDEEDAERRDEAREDRRDDGGDEDLRHDPVDLDRRPARGHQRRSDHRRR